jgi:MOSC domain-containing protein YiiM
MDKKPCSAPFVHSVFVGRPNVLRDNFGEWTSSIKRDPVSAPIELHAGGLHGDKVTQPYHGGPDAALCVHLCEHYDFWRRQYGLDLPAGTVGENFTLDGITEDEVCVGDVVRVGTSLVQVSGPRVPCANLARRIGRPDWVKLTIAENRTGFYLRVMQPGLVCAGDPWRLEDRLNEDGPMTAINRCIYLDFDREFALRIAKMTGLGKWWKQQFLEKLDRRGPHWTDTMN